MNKPVKNPPPYAVTSVDHALRIAAMLQLEGALSVSEVADRIGVARSTAHRLLAMLVYRDFAVQDDSRKYQPGSVLQLAAHSQSLTSRLRTVALPHLERLVAFLNESVNLAIRTGATTRFIASVECDQALRVGSREGMVFLAHQTTAGLLLLAELTTEEPVTHFSVHQSADQPADHPNLAKMRGELDRIRRSGFVVNKGRSERGVVAIGVPVRNDEDIAVAGLSVAIPSVRYESTRLPEIVATLQQTSRAISAALPR